MVVTEHDGDGLSVSRSYMDITRTDDFVMIQLTVSNTRTVEQKKALYARIVELLSVESASARKMFSSISCRSPRKIGLFGNGIAQYVA